MTRLGINDPVVKAVWSVSANERSGPTDVKEVAGKPEKWGCVRERGALGRCTVRIFDVTLTLIVSLALETGRR